MVFYLKINRENEYVVSNLRHWMDALEAGYDEANKIYVLCDNAGLRKKVKASLYHYKTPIHFIESRVDSKELNEIIPAITNHQWENAGYAHATTFLHARENGFSEFWNIDADDTFLCLDSFRLWQALSTAEMYFRERQIAMASFDMNHSRRVWLNGSELWTFGITYTKNDVDWISIMRSHCHDSEYWEEKPAPPNIDAFFSYLRKTARIELATFYFENVRFIHFFHGFFEYPFTSSFMIFQKGRIEYPILTGCFGMEEHGNIPVAPDDICLDIHITDKEAMAALLENCHQKNLFSKEIRAFKVTDFPEELVSARYDRYLRLNSCQSIVFYGAGQYLMYNLDAAAYALKRGARICSSDSAVWGKEIIEGAECISPEEIEDRENTMVIVSVRACVMAFDILKRLNEMNIRHVDYFNNFKNMLLGLSNK